MLADLAVVRTRPRVECARVIRLIPRHWPRALLAVALAAACGGSSSPGSPSPPPGESSAQLVTIGLNGVNPKNVVVPLGGRVRFVNSDTEPHYVGSDPH